MSLIWKILSLGLFATSLAPSTKKRESARQYAAVSFYVSAHQDDWQLFMGADAFNDIHSFDEKNGEINGTKVVMIYTTAGNLNDDDDTKTCDCHDTHKQGKKKLPYWQVREVGAKNSIHLAASKPGGYGPGMQYPKNETANINGHMITRYEFKNTVSYFLRIKSGAYGHWYDGDDFTAGTMDRSGTYACSTDFVKTLAGIYEYEMAGVRKASFHCPDPDEQVNLNDHHDHTIAGRSALEATHTLSQKLQMSFPISLFINYHTQNLPVNSNETDAQNEAALTAVYCLALLDYNVWPEWGTTYQQWTTRNYSRIVTIEPGNK